VKIALECGFAGWPGPLRFPILRIPKPFLIEFITASLEPFASLTLPSPPLNHVTPHPYSPNLVEEEFSEVHGSKVPLAGRA